MLPIATKNNISDKAEFLDLTLVIEKTGLSFKFVMPSC